MAGVQSSTFSDSGTFARVFSTFLTWAQERSCMAFIMATCNAIVAPNGQLLIPAELIRPGRFDQVFVTDQPTTREMVEILRIHISKPRMNNSGRDTNNYDIDRLSRIRYVDKDNKKYSFTGAEIEQAVIEAMYNAYYENRDYNTEDIENALRKTIPITYTMKDSLATLRKYGKERFRPASKPEDIPEFMEKGKTDL